MRRRKEKRRQQREGKTNNIPLNVSIVHCSTTTMKFSFPGPFPKPGKKALGTRLHRLTYMFLYLSPLSHCKRYEQRLYKWPDLRAEIHKSQARW